ncbi:MAG: phospholipase D-like domain-containing protein [Sumerlaeia bacterium]
MSDIFRRVFALVLAAAFCGPALRIGAQNDPAAQVTAINDRDYYPALMKLIENAQSSIELNLYQAEFYTEYPDSASNDMIAALEKASARGVVVTVVIDQSTFKGGHDERNMDVAERLAKSGALVYIDPDEIQSHQKIAVFDRACVVVASINWTHFSLSRNREAAVILWSREAVVRYHKYIAARVADGIPFLHPSIQPAPAEGALSPKTLNMSAFPAADVDYLNNRYYYVRLARALREAKSSIDVVQNYAMFYQDVPEQVYDLYPDRPTAKPSETNLILRELIAAHDRGVKVRVLFDLTWQEDFQIGWGSSKTEFAKRLADAGIEVLVDDPAEQIHAKMLVIDDEKVLVGSTNWSFHALEMNNEASVIVEAPELVQEIYVPWVKMLMDKGQPWSADLPAMAER